MLKKRLMYVTDGNPLFCSLLACMRLQGRSKGILHQMAREPLSAAALWDSQGKHSRVTNGLAGQAGLLGARKSVMHMPHAADSHGVAASASEACSHT